MPPKETQRTLMTRLTGQGRSFLFLQGPHGPFFLQLGRMLGHAGARVHRFGFNAGDAAFWPDRRSYIPYRGPPDAWGATFEHHVAALGVTDIVLYGDTRRFHAEAVAHARRMGLEVHVFEEGYLRPYWVTYERGGTNGHSRLMRIGVPEMRRALAAADNDTAPPPAHWGDMREHVFYGALYHGCVLLANRRYPHFRPHRALDVRAEFRVYLRRLLLMPAHAVERRLATGRVRRGGFPYHLVLLQLEHDSAFQAHSPFAGIAEFLELIMDGFARGAAPHHHLVVKAHPLEDGRAPIRATLRRLARAHGLRGRVHFLRGGKLAPLLDEARSAVTVNSTAAQQALWRGIPLRAFGQAVYDKPEFVSTLPLQDFFAGAGRPDRQAYADYRRFLLETSQVPGGFYSARGRRQLLRLAVDLMLAPEDPYEALRLGTAAPRQQLRPVT